MLVSIHPEIYRGNHPQRILIMFVDKTRIYIKSGKGGDGCVSFRREKYIPRGGPDGGSGGRGGDVYLEVSRQISTLLDFSYQPHYKARDGSPGSGNDRYGKDAEDLFIKVPQGTVVYRAGKDKSYEFVCDLKNIDDRILIAKGGRGGRGNATYKTQQSKAPRISERGEPGVELILDLELKLIADVGIAGCPNAGKSTLISRITSAHPKIADYPFTTTSPNLGAAFHKGKSFIVADIPGLIEGAHAGKGLGDEFLRHIERTKILIHLIDISGYGNKSAAENFLIINNELREYSPGLMKKPMVVVINKMDLTDADRNLEKFRKKFRSKKLDIFPISAGTGSGIESLLDRVIYILSHETQEVMEEGINVPAEPVKHYVYKPEFEIKKQEGMFVVEGKKIETIIAMTRFEQQESVQRLQNTFKKLGIDKMLKKHGIKEGDIVKIADYEFEWLQG